MKIELSKQELLKIYLALSNSHDLERVLGGYPSDEFIRLMLKVEEALTD